MSLNCAVNTNNGQSIVVTFVPKSQLDEVFNENQKLKEHIRVLEEEANQRNITIKTYFQTIETNKQTIDELRKENFELKNQLDDLTKQLEQANVKIKKLESHVDRLESHVDRLSVENQEFKAEFIKIQKERIDRQNLILAGEFIKSFKIVRNGNGGDAEYSEIFTDNEMLVKNLLTGDRNYDTHGDKFKDQYNTNDPEPLRTIITDQLRQKYNSLGRHKRMKYKDQETLLLTVNSMFDELIEYDKEHQYELILD